MLGQWGLGATSGRQLKDQSRLGTHETDILQMIRILTAELDI